MTGYSPTAHAAVLTVLIVGAVVVWMHIAERVFG